MTEEERKSWLDSLKEGDEVCYIVRVGGHEIDKVAKITPSRQIKTVSGKTFRNGYYKRDKWEGYFLYPVTDMVRSEALFRRLITKISNTDFRKVTLKKLKQIAEILDRSDTE